MLDCKHAKEISRRGAVTCALGLYGGKPSLGVCRNCPKREPTGGKPLKMRGLGDVVARVTKAVGLKECGGCAKRRKWLNERFPFKGE